jgi:NADPH2:quinone reductase
LRAPPDSSSSARAARIAGAKLVLDHGAHHVFDHRSPDYLEKILALTGGRGVDVILEMLANVNLGKIFRFLRRTGA